MLIKTFHINLCMNYYEFVLCESIQYIFYTPSVANFNLVSRGRKPNQCSALPFGPINMGFIYLGLLKFLMHRKLRKQGLPYYI